MYPGQGFLQSGRTFSFLRLPVTEAAEVTSQATGMAVFIVLTDRLLGSS